MTKLSSGILAALALGAQAVALQVPVDRKQCDVNIWSSHNVAGSKCRFMDEVMVGIAQLDPLIIKCARITVRCDRHFKEAEDEKSQMP